MAGQACVRGQPCQQRPSRTPVSEDLRAPGPRPQDNRGQMLFMLYPGAKELSLVEPWARFGQRVF